MGECITGDYWTAAPPKSGTPAWKYVVVKLGSFHLFKETDVSGRRPTDVGTDSKMGTHTSDSMQTSALTILDLQLHGRF